MLVKLQIIHLEVTEWHQRDQVLSYRKASVTNPASPLEMLPSVNECLRSDSRGRERPDVDRRQVSKAGSRGNVKTAERCQGTTQTVAGDGELVVPIRSHFPPYFIDLVEYLLQL